MINVDNWQTSAGVNQQTIIQTKVKNYIDTFSTNGSQADRIVIPNFYVDITPKYNNSKIIVMCSIAIGWSNTPEWSWFVDRTVGAVTTKVGAAARVGNRMNGYHGGPRDGGAVDWTREVESFSNCLTDTPNTTSSCRYQVCLQDWWANYTYKYVNRSGDDSNNGYHTRGSSNLIVMEVRQ